MSRGPVRVFKEFASQNGPEALSGPAKLTLINHRICLPRPTISVTLREAWYRIDSDGVQACPARPTNRLSEPPGD